MKKQITFLLVSFFVFFTSCNNQGNNQENYQVPNHAQINETFKNDLELIKSLYDSNWILESKYNGNDMTLGLSFLSNETYVIHSDKEFIACSGTYRIDDRGYFRLEYPLSTDL